MRLCVAATPLGSHFYHEYTYCVVTIDILSELRLKRSAQRTPYEQPKLEELRIEFYLILLRTISAYRGPTIRRIDRCAPPKLLIIRFDSDRLEKSSKVIHCVELNAAGCKSNSSAKPAIVNSS